MPQSRKRKTRRGGPSSRTTYSSKKQSNNTTKLVIYLVIAALAIGALVYLLSLMTGTSGSPPTIPPNAILHFGVELLGVK